jgi:predicted acylesterase/phospholipase RssA
MSGVSVALSGGGHRAALWGAGVLLYLADAGINRDVTSIASVSGGSITNAYVAQQVNYRRVDGPALEQALRPLIRRLAVEGTVQWAPLTKLYLGALVAFVGVATGIWFIAIPTPARAAICTVSALAVLWGLTLRGAVADRVLARQLFSTGHRRSQLSELEPHLAGEIDHVFCATDLQSSEHVYFSPRFVYSYRHGLGRTGSLLLSTAVQVSAALPGPFPPRWLRARPFGFEGGEAQTSGRTVRHLVLADGGVYDNMADQWAQGFQARSTRWPRLKQEHHEPLELVVANASAGLEWQRAGWALRVPLLGELLSLLRVKDVLYDNTTTLRRQGMAGRFDRAIREQRGLRGALVHIPQSPFDVAKDCLEPERASRWPDRAERAATVIERLGLQTEGSWARIAQRSKNLPTVLKGFGAQDSADLLLHAYVLAMCNLHVILGYPLIEIPSAERFADLMR